jgi:SecD/SecF fusion protein
MFKQNIWKLLLSVAIAGWAVSQLLPLRDIYFPTYVKEHVSGKPEEFAKLMDEAAGRQKSGQASSVFVALKQIATERKLDLTQYFPKIWIESTLHNVARRNDILLNELLRRSKGRLQLGLDLHGGVAVTLEVDPKVTARDPAT